ncbi:hypothetical protein [Agarilytica rhodophyticola]|uniref:hypothetical protein n=1 Tax=Agarilytica rhodophyticola TaxID=1737490 RepID=UPI000B3489A5|nr:hypothetical protein [Agarilytica rhodophyticola]
MPFDLSTARPVQQKKSGFDLSTARPVQIEQPSQEQNLLSPSARENLSPEQQQQLIDAKKAQFEAVGAPEFANTPTASTKRKNFIEELREKNPQLASVVEEVGGAEAFLIGAGEGFTSLGRGIGLADQPDETEKVAAQALRDYTGAATAGKITGQVAPFLVPGLAASNIASIPARTAAMSGIGATEGGVIARGEGGETKDVVAGAGLGLLLGGGSEILMPVLNSLGRRIIARTHGESAAPAVTPSGAPTPELQSALDDVGLTFDDLIEQARRAADEAPTPEAQSALDAAGTTADEVVDRTLRQGDSRAANSLRQGAFEDLGVTPTEAQRTRDTDLFVDQQDAFRRSGAVRDAVEQQDAILDTAARNEISRIGGTVQNASASPIEAVLSKTNHLNDEISQLYKEAREALPNDKNIKFNSAAKSLQRNRVTDELSGGVVKALRRHMKDLGVIDSNFKPVGRVSVDQAENIRKFANRLLKSTNGEGRHIIGQFKDALDEDVLRVAGNDFFERARRAKTNFERGLDPVKRDGFDQRKTSIVRDIRDNLIDEDEFFEKAIKRSSKYKPRDLRELRNYLLTGTESQIRQGQKAWDDVRSAALERIREKSFKGAETSLGTKSISRAGIDSALKEIGEPKLHILFSDKERAFIKKLSRIAALKEPPPATFTGSGPSSVAIENTTLKVLGAIPVIGEFLKASLGSMKNKVTEQRVLTLIDDAIEIQRENVRREFLQLRQSRTGAAVFSAPAGAVATQQEQ